jgi:hypothetical protein
MPDEKLPRFLPAPDISRDLTILRMEVEAIHVWLAQMPTRKILARAALGIIFCTAVVTTLFGWFYDALNPLPVVTWLLHEFSPNTGRVNLIYRVCLLHNSGLTFDAGQGELISSSGAIVGPGLYSLRRLSACLTRLSRSHLGASAIDEPIQPIVVGAIASMAALAGSRRKPARIQHLIHPEWTTLGQVGFGNPVSRAMRERAST